MSPNDTDEVAHGARTHGGFPLLVVGAIGVVFGDIGTSPLYTLKEAFSPHYGLTPDQATVLGILSLVFWALMIIVTLKYVAIIMRADNEGEGGIMALMALVQRARGKRGRVSYLVGILGIFGAALFFGDGVITPAITVLGAIEGIGVVAPALGKFIVPVAVAILLALFATQRFGTARVGRVFGPVMAAWFVAIAAIGAINIAANPSVFGALNPAWGVRFFAEHGWHALFILGAVVLAVTGGEALYADMGHFGARPIRWAWVGFVMPALVTNYFGQGALLLANPAAVSNPFYLSVPAWAQYPMIGLATAAAVIAAQAVITGAFSVARQAVLLGYLPRMVIKHTSHATIGQIYVPAINRVLMVSVIALVVSFGSSTALASAYGVSVSGTMLIDTILLALLAAACWKDSRWWVVPLCAVFAVIEIAFLVANGVKFLDGAWFPIVLGIVAFTIMRTWRRGRELLSAEIREAGAGTIKEFMARLDAAPVLTAPGTAIFLTRQRGVVPHALVQNIRHNNVLHERNVLLNVDVLDTPLAHAGERAELEQISDRFWTLRLKFGFMERPNVPKALGRLAREHATLFDPKTSSFFASHQTVLPSVGRGMAFWRDLLYAYMHRNATPATDFFCVPGARLVQLGTQIEI